MTSATGEMRLGCLLKPRAGQTTALGRGSRLGLAPLGGRASGFTLVEILVDIAIIVLLFGLVAVSLKAYIGKAAVAATKATITKLEQYLDQYKSLAGYYPPDGIDSPVENEDGVPIKSSACLHYFLTRPIVVRLNVGGRTELKEYPPFTEFKSLEVGSEDPEYKGVREIIDGWGTPIHYDNTEDGSFRPQRGEVHAPPVDDDSHPPDPRDGEFEVDGQKAVPKPGVQSRAFDIWSHAEQGHEAGAKPNLPIATWNIKE